MTKVELDFGKIDFFWKMLILSFTYDADSLFKPSIPASHAVLAKPKHLESLS